MRMMANFIPDVYKGKTFRTYCIATKLLFCVKEKIRIRSKSIKERKSDRTTRRVTAFQICLDLQNNTQEHILPWDLLEMANELVFTNAGYNDQRRLDCLIAVYWLGFSGRLLSTTGVLRAPVLYVSLSVLVVLQLRRSVQSSPLWLYRKMLRKSSNSFIINAPSLKSLIALMYYQFYQQFLACVPQKGLHFCYRW